jgi:hypothetical protein
MWRLVSPGAQSRGWADTDGLPSERDAKRWLPRTHRAGRLDSDATLIIYFDELGGGTEQTLLHCIRRHKPYKLVDANEISAQRAGALAASFVATHDIATLNVAGPRGSNVPAAHGFAYGCISYLLATVQGREPDHQLGRD